MVTVCGHSGRLLAEKYSFQIIGSPSGLEDWGPNASGLQVSSTSTIRIKAAQSGRSSGGGAPPIELTQGSRVWLLGREWPHDVPDETEEVRVCGMDKPHLSDAVVHEIGEGNEDGLRLRRGRKLIDVNQTWGESKVKFHEGQDDVETMAGLKRCETRE